jgi:hypothetical protein
MFKPPTDNLYKFLSIFGLVLIVTSGIALSESIDKGALIFDEELRQIESKSTADFNFKQALDAKLALVTKTKDFGSAEFSKELTAIEEDIDRKRNTLSELHSQIYKRSVAKIKLDILETIASAGLLVGILLSGVGFVLWYIRVQVFQDAKLRREAEPGSRSKEDAAVREPTKLGAGSDEDTEPEEDAEPEVDD